MGQLVSEEEVKYYDIAVQDWPGEIEFYRAMVSGLEEKGGSLLELGCGTGRVTIPLAQAGIHAVGLDLSPSMLAIARQKSKDLPNLHWMEGDMRAFELGAQFDLILIPGHAFQFMLTPADQAACLTCIQRHLAPGGKLVVHLNHDDLDWLGRLSNGQGTGFELVGEYRQNSMDGFIRKWNAWSYEATTQTAKAVTAWEIIGKDGVVMDRKENEVKLLHCVFRFEMEHLLGRTGFEVEALYGDFFRQELKDASSEMIWVVRAVQP